MQALEIGQLDLELIVPGYKHYDQLNKAMVSHCAPSSKILARYQKAFVARRLSFLVHKLVST